MNRILKLASAGLIVTGLPFIAFAQGTMPGTVQGTTQGTPPVTTPGAGQSAMQGKTAPATMATPDAKAGMTASTTAPAHDAKAARPHAAAASHPTTAHTGGSPTTASMTTKPAGAMEKETAKPATQSQVPATAATGGKS